MALQFSGAKLGFRETMRLIDRLHALEMTPLARDRHGAIGVLAHRVVVQDQHAQPLAGAGGGPLQHLQVAGRVAERG